jgi:hypothetical protein
MSDIIAPIVNMNGTSGRQLLEDACSALEAIRAAQDALSAVAPHGRDYIHTDSATYANAHVTYALARAQYGRWREALHVVGVEVEALAIKISEQVR